MVNKWEFSDAFELFEFDCLNSIYADRTNLIFMLYLYYIYVSFIELKAETE